MRIPQRLIFTCTIINSEAIIRIRPTGKFGPKLPHHITRDARLGQRCVLPFPHDGDPVFAVGHGVFLQKDGFAEVLPDGVMLRDPGIAPRVIVAPEVGIEVESAVIDCGDGEVLLEVNTFVARVSVAAVVVWEVGRCGGEPSFVTKGN